MQKYDKDLVAKITASGVEKLRKAMSTLETNSTFGDNSFKTGTGVTVEDLLKLKGQLAKDYPTSIGVDKWMYGATSDYCSMKVFETSYLPTTTEEYEVEVELTFKQRWIEPLLHGVTMPFQPWVKTRTEIRTREVQAAFKMGNSLYCSPYMMAGLRKFEGVLRNESIA